MENPRVFVAFSPNPESDGRGISDQRVGKVPLGLVALGPAGGAERASVHARVGREEAPVREPPQSPLSAVLVVAGVLLHVAARGELSAAPSTSPKTYDFNSVQIPEQFRGSAKVLPTVDHPLWSMMHIRVGSC